MKFFTSDPHYFHENVIEYENRPYKNLHEMHKSLINNWNECVTPDDEVYILGDFSLKRGRHRDQLEKIVRKLNGTKHLILGNHDVLKPFTYIDIGFTSVHTVLEVEEFILVHDPAVATVNKNKHWLCGHVHDLFKTQKHVINVGVDVWDYKPVSIDEIRSIIQEQNLELMKKTV